MLFPERGQLVIQVLIFGWEKDKRAFIVGKSINSLIERSPQPTMIVIYVFTDFIP